MVLEQGKKETLDRGVDETQIETATIAAEIAAAMEKLLHQLQKTPVVTVGLPSKSVRVAQWQKLAARASINRPCAVAQHLHYSASLLPLVFPSPATIPFWSVTPPRVVAALGLWTAIISRTAVLWFFTAAARPWYQDRSSPL